MLLHYVHDFTEPQTTVDVDCACVAEIVHITVNNIFKNKHISVSLK